MVFNGDSLSQIISMTFPTISFKLALKISELFFNSDSKSISQSNSSEIRFNSIDANSISDLNILLNKQKN